MVSSDIISEHVIHCNSDDSFRKTVVRGWIIAVLTVMGAFTVVIGQTNSDDVNWLIESLELKEGSIVADIGAGDGDQTLAIARHIGSEGKIYSTELGSESLQNLREEIEQASVTNVSVVEGQPKKTNLPAECCDALYLRKVYHHFADPATMNASLWRSLKPGGRLAVIDFEPRGSEANPAGRAEGSQHGVTSDTVVDELKQAGFILISTDKRSSRDIYIIMKKPDHG